MIKVLNISLFDSNIVSAVNLVLHNFSSNTKQNLLISATGAHGIITAKKYKEFKDILNSFYINLPDGMPGVWVGRLKGAKEMKRCYGPEFFMETMKITAGTDIKHYFCGGKEGVAEELKGAVARKFNNLNVVGTYSPPFREMTDAEMKELADKINLNNTNIVWVGLSTPKQEKFAYRLSKFTNVNFICTVGAAFDFHIDKLKQAPPLLQKMSLEWLFRLVVEPKRLWKRYFEIVPKFIYYNLVELLRGDFFNYSKREESENG